MFNIKVQPVSFFTFITSQFPSELTELVPLSYSWEMSTQYPANAVFSKVIWSLVIRLRPLNSAECPATFWNALLSKCFWLMIQNTLRTHITFSIAPAKKISLTLFIFTQTLHIYLKGRINFLSNHGTLRYIKNDFGEKNSEHFYDSWSLKSEKVQGCEVLAIKIESLESLLLVL